MVSPVGCECNDQSIKSSNHYTRWMELNDAATPDTCSNFYFVSLLRMSALYFVSALPS